MSEEQQNEKVPAVLELAGIPRMEEGLPAAWAVWCEIDERAQAYAEITRRRGESPIAATRRQVAAFEHLGLAAAWAKGMTQTLIAIYADKLEPDAAAFYLETIRQSYSEAWGAELLAKMEASWMQAFHRALVIRREGLGKVEARRVAFESNRAPVLEGDVSEDGSDYAEGMEALAEHRREGGGGVSLEQLRAELEGTDEQSAKSEEAPAVDVHGIPIARPQG